MDRGQPSSFGAAIPFPSHPLPSTTYATLKALDADTTRTLVAQVAMAMSWESGAIAAFCKFTGANPLEVDKIVRAARAAKDYASGVSYDAAALQPGYLS